MTDANFISQQDTLEMFGRSNVSFVDASWYLPAQERNGYEEYMHMRLPGAVFFDIDEIADQDTELPHMLPSPTKFAQHVSTLGIADDNLIIVYDGPGLFSAPRAWWTFKIMGASDVRILEGGIDGWKNQDLPIETGNPNPPLARIFNTNMNTSQVANLGAVKGTIASSETVVLDARPRSRFLGEAAEPRPGLRSGHIPGSISLPFTELMDGARLKSPAELELVFSALGISKDQPVITSCGSGVTAAILTLALDQTGRKNTKLYDGSWAEWGMPEGPEIATDASE